MLPDDTILYSEFVILYPELMVAVIQDGSSVIEIDTVLSEERDSPVYKLTITDELLASYPPSED
jgi:hypothetical protein